MFSQGKRVQVSWESDVAGSQIFQTLYIFSIISLVLPSAYNLGRHCPGCHRLFQGQIFFPQSFFSLGFCHEEPDVRRELSKYLSKYLWNDMNEYRAKNRTFSYLPRTRCTTKQTRIDFAQIKRHLPDLPNEFSYCFCSFPDHHVYSAVVALIFPCTYLRLARVRTPQGQRPFLVHLSIVSTEQSVWSLDIQN